MSQSFPRRSVLKGGAAALAGAALPACKSDEDSGGAPAAGRVDHVVVVMMENRSFDHYLGALELVEGRTDVEGLTGTESNPALDGSPVTVFHLDEDCTLDPPHSWNGSHDQFNEGANDGFVREHETDVGAEDGRKVMGYYTREDLPIHWALASEYVLPDHWFCSVMSSTWPNRLYGHAGTSDGQTNNDFPEGGGFTFPTVYSKLEEAGLEWNYVYTDVPFIGLFVDHWDLERVKSIDHFLEDVAAGILPPFTWIDPAFSFNDDHPPHHPGLGQMFLAMVYEALAQSPAWERTLLVITYDEHGGFYDHVPPPTTDDDFAAEGFDQLGFRVPTVVAGPWLRQGVDHTVFDHASVLKYVCERFGLTPWTRRIAASNSIGVLLDADRMAANTPRAPIQLPAFAVPEEEITEDCQYDGVFSNPIPGQAELAEWLRRFQPGLLEAVDVGARKAAILGHLRRLGLLS